MDYNSVQDIIAAGTTNATVLVNNVGHDDDTVTISNIPNWIKFNGSTPSNMYASGNSWLGIISNSEQFRFNRRDTKMWYLWVEEGTLYETLAPGKGIPFYRVRWRGYSHYGQTSNSYLQEWELIFFGTGDIMLHAINIPSVSWDGTFNLVANTTYTYTKPTVANPYVSFYTQDINNSTFTLDYAIINIDIPFDKFYLLRDVDNKYYTVVNDALEEITVTTLNAQVFKDYGVRTAPSGTLLMQLTDPTVLYWQDSSGPLPMFDVNVVAIPNTQIIYSQNIQMLHHTILGIENVVIDCSGDPVFAMSFDAGITWKAYVNGSWTTLSQSTSGNTEEEVESISTPAWNAACTNNQIMFRITLGEGDVLTQIQVNYLN